MKPRFSLSRYALGYIALGVLALALFTLSLWHFQLLGDPFWYGILGDFALVLLLGGVFTWRSRRLLLAELNEIRQSEQRYALVMSASEDGFWDWKVAGDELYVSPRFLEMFDFSPDTTFAGRAAMFKRLSIPAADREALERAVAEHFAGKTARMEIEFRALVRGEERWMRATGRATRDASGAVSRWNGAVRDVTARRRGEEALRRSEGRYARVLEASNEALWEWNPVTDEMFMSERARHLWAVPDGAVVRTRAELKKLGRFHPEDLQRTEDEVAASRGPGARSLDLEYRVIGADGEVRWLRSQAKMFFDERDAPARMTGSLTDITERKLADLALAESEARFRSLTELSNDFFWEADAEHRYTVIELGRAYAGVRNNVSKLGLARWEIPYASPDEAAWAAHRAAIAARERFVEFRFSRIEEGEERFYEHSGEPHYDAEGNFLGYRGVGRDVTARKRAEEALRESEKRYERAMLASNAGLWEWDALKDEYYISPRHLELLGFPPGTTFSGRDDFLRRVPFHPEDLGRWRQAQRQLFESGGSYLVMDIRVIGDGETRWVRVNALCFREGEGRVVRWSGSVTDVTEAKRAEEALRRSEERYSLAMDASEEGHFDVNLDTDEHFISERLNEIHDFRLGARTAKRSEFIKHVRFYGDDAEKFYAAIAAAEAKDGPERYECEFRIVRPSGEVRWLRTCGKVTRDAEGRARRRTGVVADITPRKLAEEALRESEQRYELAMAASESGYWDWHIPTGRYFVSARANKLVGFETENTFADRADFKARMPIHPEDSARWEAAREDLFAGTGERIAMECRYIVRGETRWHSLQAICRRDGTGKVVRWTGSATDITQRKLAEEALRASEERYSLAMEASEEGHFDLNIETGEIFISERLNEIYGFAPGTRFVNRDEYLAQVRLHGEDVEKYHAVLDAAVARQGPERYEFEFRIVRPSGEVRWLRTRGKVMRDAEGRACRRTGVVADITERKLAIDTLRNSESRFRTLVELNAGGFWEQDENLRYAPSTFPHDITGYSTDDRIGKTRWELAGHLTPLSGSWADHQAVLAARQPFRDFEYRRIRPDGQIGYYSASGAPIFDDDGRFKGYYGAASDITERKRFEEQLRSRQEMLDLAQKSAQAIVFEWRIGSAGEGQNRWSPDLEAMYGLVPGTYDGSFERWKNLVHPEDRPAVKQAIKHARQTGEVASEYRVVHPDGSVHWLQARGRMLFDGEGKPTRIVGFMQDVTQRRQAQRLEAMGTLAGGIAHDFNNILGAILGYGEMALRDAPKGTRLRRDLGSIMTAGERGRALVDRVLAFSRSGVGERVAVHVEKGVREALDLLAAKLPQGVRIEAKLGAGRAAMLGDPTQVHQVLMNLGTNAVQAMTAGGILFVSLDAVHFDTPRPATIGTVGAGDYIVLKVADEGIGIPAEIVERIFDPFFTTKEVGTGTGLGLSLVHGIVAEVGGAIEVASTPGAGSTFTVYLPRSGDALDSFQEEELEMPRGDGQRVLVVDDEEPLVKLATRTLEELGYSAAGFTSSAAALSAFRAEPERFQALITDERMPGMSGSALIREVRILHKSIPIVLMSGFVGGPMMRTAREAGADEVLKKPLSARDLANSLARVLHP